jgi:dipeptidyl aminopeptidase/acylaminoacyl peptidase
MGGSYGGFMVLAALTSDPDLLAAGVDIVGIANFITFLRNTGPWRRALREAEYGSLAADSRLPARDQSTSSSDRYRIAAPLLVIHVANDPRVPVGEAEQIVALLRAPHHPVEYLRFEDEGHGRRQSSTTAWSPYPAIGDFLDRHLLAD